MDDKAAFDKEVLTGMFDNGVRTSPSVKLSMTGSSCITVFIVWLYFKTRAFLFSQICVRIAQRMHVY